MGGGSSSCYSDFSVEKHLPDYYIKGSSVTPDEVARAKASWDSILNDECSAHIKYIESTDSNGSALIWFYDNFYQHLFEIHPQCRKMFNGSMKAQGKVLVKIIGISIGLTQDEAAVGKILSALAKTHAERGIKAYEYGIAGTCLFWTLEHCLGAEKFNAELRSIWTRIFCLMLDVLIPAALYQESKLQKCVEDRSVSAAIEPEVLAILHITAEAAETRSTA